MALAQRVHPMYKPSDIHLLRLKKMCYVATGVMHHVYREGTKRRAPNQSLFEFYEGKGIRIIKFKNNLNKKQMQLVENDPEGHTFDITLLFQCIQWGCDGVVNKNDDTWKAGNNCLESLLTEVKTWRNELSHGEIQYDEQQFFDQTEKIRSLLTKLLEHASKRYGITKTDTDLMIIDMNDKINQLRDESWMPLDFATYKKLNLFSEKESYIRDEGKLCLYNLYTGWVIICPSSLLCKVNFKVNEIYTQMVLAGESLQGKKIIQKLESILDGIDQKSADPLILLEGHAGSGKSTLTKKILSDWVSGQSSISNLSGYDLLLFTEFRNQSLKSFKDLVNFLMPEISKSFQDGDFCSIILNNKVMVVLDGLDEMNSSSICLFKEILELKKTHGISVVVTSRPERIETYFSLSKSHHMKTKHIMITGISPEKREDFVRKYYKEMEKEGETTEDISGLLTYLKRTAHRLSHLWCLPYNLTLLIILWVYKSQAVNSITTAPELYWEIYLLYQGKLLDRLHLNEVTQNWEETVMKKKMEDFMSLLGYVALICLAKDKIELPEKVYNRLRDHCINEDLPTQEMTGAFLKLLKIKTPCGYENKYSFPHKGLQEFLAAMYIFMKAEQANGSQCVGKVPQEIEDMLCKHNIGNYERQNILKSIFETMYGKAFTVASPSTSNVSTEKTGFVKDILINVTENSELNLEKYQNLLVTLLGLFHLRSSNIKDDIKKEVLNLLQESGVTRKDDWLNILDSVKCDESVATFLSEQHNIFQGDIEISDHNIYAFNSLLQSHSAPIKDADKVTVNLEIHEEAPVLSTLLEAINNKGFNIREFKHHYGFQNPGALATSEAAINSVLQRCALSDYVGPYIKGMILPDTAKEPWLSVGSEESYLGLVSYLTIRKIDELALSLGAGMNHENLKPIPEPLMFLPRLMLPDIDSKNVYNAVKVARAVQPVTGNYRMYDFVYYARATFDVSDIEIILREMGRQNVRCNVVVFPSTLNPPPGEQERLRDIAKNEIGCEVEWGIGGIDDW